ncbi:uncharacterized protein LOC133900544 [Phragmites australis]|uniref:uncharacterized protein LOC133900544 n=1 Tax=Phragmites australis TaxID=29695 RepID=UPI002D783118|nr:uncharacterized protein LOC133900544 [Phragmites australis]
MNRRQTRLPLLLLFACVAAVLLASRGVVAAFSAGAVAMPALRALQRVEDDVSGFAEGEEAAAYPRRRTLYDGGSISYGALAASKAACYGPCPARGQPYTGRGCLSIYQCRG